MVKADIIGLFLILGTNYCLSPLSILGSKDIQVPNPSEDSQHVNNGKEYNNANHQK